MNLEQTATRRRIWLRSDAVGSARRVAGVLAGPLLIAGLAVFLRVYRLELQAWTPDTYEQLEAASRLVRGEFPLSRLYPPGVAVTLAPAFLLFPDALATMQAVIIAMSLAVVVLAYVWSRQLIDDERAALMAAFSVAVFPQFVYFSRDGLFDVMGTAYLLGSVFAARFVRDRGVMAGIGYGVLLAITMNIRATNPAIVPAILIYALAPDFRANLRRALPAMAAAGVIAVVLTMVGMLVGGWWGTTTNGATTFEKLVPNIAFYLRTIAGDFIFAPFVVPLAAAGAHRLWRRNPAFILMTGYMIIVWPAVHGPFIFANTRYMLPVVFLMLLLAAHGASALLSARAPSRLALFKQTAAPATALFLGLMLLSGAMIVRNWEDMSSRSNEAAFTELRPQLAELPDDSLVVGAVLRGLRASNARVEYLDLIDHSLSTGNTPERIDEVVAQVAETLDEGRDVYYVYSAFESDEDSLGKGGTGYDAYFEAISDTFDVSVVYQATLETYRILRVDLQEPVRR
jgi:hypothetical protein